MEKKLRSWSSSLQRSVGRRVGREIRQELGAVDGDRKVVEQQREKSVGEKEEKEEKQAGSEIKQKGSWKKSLKISMGRRVEREAGSEIRGRRGGERERDSGEQEIEQEQEQEQEQEPKQEDHSDGKNDERLLSPQPQNTSWKTSLKRSLGRALGRRVREQLGRDHGLVAEELSAEFNSEHDHEHGQPELAPSQAGEDPTHGIDSPRRFKMQSRRPGAGVRESWGVPVGRGSGERVAWSRGVGDGALMPAENMYSGESGGLLQESTLDTATLGSMTLNSTTSCSITASPCPYPHPLEVAPRKFATWAPRRTPFWCCGSTGGINGETREMSRGACRGARARDEEDSSVLARGVPAQADDAHTPDSASSFTWPTSADPGLLEAVDFVPMRSETAQDVDGTHADGGDAEDLSPAPSCGEAQNGAVDVSAQRHTDARVGANAPEDSIGEGSEDRPATRTPRLNQSLSRIDTLRERCMCKPHSRRRLSHAEVLVRLARIDELLASVPRTAVDSDAEILLAGHEEDGGGDEGTEQTVVSATMGPVILGARDQTQLPVSIAPECREKQRTSRPRGSGGLGSGPEPAAWFKSKSRLQSRHVPALSLPKAAGAAVDTPDADADRSSSFSRKHSTFPPPSE